MSQDSLIGVFEGWTVANPSAYFCLDLRPHDPWACLIAMNPMFRIVNPIVWFRLKLSEWHGGMVSRVTHSNLKTTFTNTRFIYLYQYYQYYYYYHYRYYSSYYNYWYYKIIIIINIIITIIFIIINRWKKKMRQTLKCQTRKSLRSWEFVISSIHHSSK